MHYTRNTVLEDQLLDEMMDNISDATRLHPSVTDLIYCLTKKWYDSRNTDKKHSRKTKLYFITGLALEQALLPVRKEHVTVGEYEGIHFHVDSMDQGLLEVKSTRGRANKSTPDVFSEGWIRQAKAYCKVQGLLELDFAVVHVIEPEIQAWRVEFTQEEVDSNWAWMQERREVWHTADLMGQPPPAFTTNMDWECKDCDYKLLCELSESLKRVSAISYE